MSEYWLISVPAEEDTVENAWKNIETLSNKHKLSQIFKFQIPDIRIGTLDGLVSMGDELKKLDPYVGLIIQNIARCMYEIVESKDKVIENLIVEEQDLPTYMANFKWDLAKYPIAQTTQNIAKTISKNVATIDAELKTKMADFANIKNDFLKAEKKQTGSLLTRNLEELVKKEHFVLNSEFMTTLLVVVPKSLSKDWKKKYETLIEMVVPESSELIFQDDEHGLHTVTIFKKFIQEFKQSAGKHKFIVRDFVYDEKVLAKNREEIKQLRTDKTLEHGQMVRWLKATFGECFSAWMHVKALQVFIESVLRYGLPAKFQAIVVHPQKKTSKRFREILNDHLEHLDMSFMLDGTKNDYGVIIPELDDGKNEYFPYVNFSISIEMFDHN